jgi:hypothetical protein
MTMSEKLLQYLQGISGDAAKLKEFHVDPQAAIAGANLSPAESKAVLSKSPGALAAAIRSGSNIAASDDINITIVLVVAP